MIDLFNRKKLKAKEEVCEGYRAKLSDRNKEIESLNKLLAEKDNSILTLRKNYDKLYNENQNLINWIQKILEVNDTQIINEKLDRITIPIYQQRITRAYDDKNWEHEEEITDIIVPEIHYRIINGRRH